MVVVSGELDADERVVAVVLELDDDRPGRSRDLSAVEHELFGRIRSRAGPSGGAKPLWRTGMGPRAV